jgi:hypothetical protein
MSLIVADTGKIKFLDFLTAFGGIGLAGLWARLFTNNYTPVHGMVPASFTEAIWAGYAKAQLTGWGGSALNGTNHAFSTATLIGFANTSGVSQDTYGYYVTDDPITTVFFAERFAGAPVAIPNGLSLGLQVQFTQTSEF